MKRIRQIIKTINKTMIYNPNANPDLTCALIDFQMRKNKTKVNANRYNLKNSHCMGCANFPIKNCKAVRTDENSCNGCPCFDEETCLRGISCLNNTQYPKEIVDRIKAETKFKVNPNFDKEAQDYLDQLDDINKVMRKGYLV